MSILTPVEAIDPAPTPNPRCEYNGDVTGRCKARASHSLGVIRTCGCGNVTGYLCSIHVNCGQPDGCADCGTLNAISLTEPVRLRGAASDGRTE